MTRLSSEQRKLIYLMGIVVLFLIILLLQGQIDRKRTQYRLTEQSIGEMDEVGFTINLVLVGFRGIAVNLLWSQYRDMQKRHNWEEMLSVNEQIAALQPHFITVWVWHAWNLAYNVSVEWDAVEDKYWWIKKGIRFLQRGRRKNRNNPDILWNIGWTFFQKIGKSDEHKLFRKLFRDDDNPEDSDTYVELLQGMPVGQRDNFLESYKWFVEAIATGRKPSTLGRSPFMTYPAQAKSAYAEYLMNDGTFGQRAMEAWQDALDEWNRLRESLKIGLIDVPQPERGNFNSDAAFRTVYLAWSKKMGVYDWAIEHDDAERDKPLDDDTLKKMQWLWFQAKQKRRIINYHSWVLRCQAEIVAVPANRQFWLGRDERRKANYPKAIKHYERGFHLWSTLFLKGKSIPPLRPAFKTEADYRVAYKKWAVHLQLMKPGDEVTDDAIAKTQQRWQRYRAFVFFAADIQQQERVQGIGRALKRCKAKAE